MPDSTAPKTDPEILRSERAALDLYWRRNLMIMGVLLTVWALVSLGCGILWVDYLNQYYFFNTGFPLGFWFAQQGSIITFVFIVLIYALLMNRADRRHHEERIAFRREIEAKRRQS